MTGLVLPGVRCLGMCLICVTRRFFYDRHSNSEGKQLLSKTLTSIMTTVSGLSSIIGWTCVLIITDVHGR